MQRAGIGARVKCTDDDFGLGRVFETLYCTLSVISSSAQRLYFIQSKTKIVVESLEEKGVTARSGNTNETAATISGLPVCVISKGHC